MPKSIYLFCVLILTSFSNLKAQYLDLDSIRSYLLREAYDVKVKMVIDGFETTPDKQGLYYHKTKESFLYFKLTNGKVTTIDYGLKYGKHFASIRNFLLSISKPDKVTTTEENDREDISEIFELLTHSIQLITTSNGLFIVKIVYKP